MPDLHISASVLEPPSPEPAEEPAANRLAAEPVSGLEPRGERFARHARRARMYASAGAFVALAALLVVLASRNTGTAKLDWVVGSTHAALSWIILAAAVFGWLLGLTTAAIVRRRTRQAR